MSIVYREVEDSGIANVRITGKESIDAFKMLVQRGANVWDRAPPEMKEFADVVTEGKIQQDYFAQENLPKP